MLLKISEGVCLNPQRFFGKLFLTRHKKVTYVHYTCRTDSNAFTTKFFFLASNECPSLRFSSLKMC